ncbi:MAG: hypothetical protein AAGJ87_15110, partial [Pseudomonadota bacterium]
MVRGPIIAGVFLVVALFSLSADGEVGAHYVIATAGAIGPDPFGANAAAAPVKKPPGASRAVFNCFVNEKQRSDVDDVSVRNADPLAVELDREH